MAYNDKKFGPILPTRFGTPNGKNTERAMLDRLGSSEGYRTQVRLNADGSTTTLRTRNGAPKFTTTRPETPEEMTGTAAYMETGQLESMPTAPEHPDRGKPAKWHLLDIDHDGDELYLGKIEVPPVEEAIDLLRRRPQFGRQLNKPEITEGMDSLAIGYPRSDDPVIDAENKAAFEGLIIEKTLASGLFMASLFSGKMRLFVQALHGAELTPKGSPLKAELVGTEVVLRYYGKDGESIQFGLWGHNSPGIFTAVDSQGRPVGKFWLISIRNPTGTQFIATAYKIKFNAPGKAIRKQYLKRVKQGALQAEITKIEAYLFAHSTIDVSNPVVVGGFTGAPGGPMAYGWKFNSTGSKASMVSHEILGTGVADLRWKARTTHATFTHTFDSSTRLDVLAVTHEVLTHGEWTDGWGAFNIFTPLEDVGTDALGHFSLATNRLGVKPAFSFDVHVYGFYKNDVWKPVLMSRYIEVGPWPKQEQTCTMLPDPQINPLTVFPRYHYDARLLTQDWDYDYTSRTEGSTMNLQFDGNLYEGVSWFGSRSRIEVRITSLGTWGGPASWVNYLSANLPDGNLYFHPPAVFGNPPGWDAYASYPWGSLRQESAHFLSRYGTSTKDEWNTTGYMSHAWTLVIPAYDCEAVFVGTHVYDLPTTVVHTRQTGSALTGIAHDGSIYGGSSVGRLEVIPYTGYYGYTIMSPITSTTDALPPVTPQAYIFCFNTAISGTQGSYHASSTPLFQVDWQWPYYMAGMGASTSFGKRYAVSENLKSHISVVYPRGFVGWA